MVRINKEKYKVYNNVFDESTLRVLFKLSAQGHFEELKSPISIGKESNVFSAINANNDTVAVKIYRTAANFKKMYKYMLSDPRFIRLKGTKFNVIYAWARKEYRNLLRARAAKVKVPMPIAVYKNVLIMQFVGDKEAAKRIVNNPPADPKLFYEMLIKDVCQLYRDARLVHADLSEFNILNWNGRPVIIDLSHAMTLEYPGVERLLKRDIRTVCNYFNRKCGLDLDWEEEFERCITKK